MHSALNLDKATYISSKDASKISGYTRDYISRLCRMGQVQSKLIGKAWFVHEDSFSQFLAQHLQEKELQRAKLSEQRKFELQTRVQRMATVLPREFFVDPYQFVFSSQAQKRQALVYALFFVLITFSLQSISFVTFSRMQQINMQEQTAQVFDAALTFGKHTFSFFSSLWQRGLALFAPLSEIEHRAEKKIEQSSETAHATAATTSNTVSEFQEGMIVVPENKAIDKDAELEKIRRSFSDDVEVVADEDGTAGVIVPQFKERSGDEYWYVLVPIEEEEP